MAGDELVDLCEVPIPVGLAAVLTDPEQPPEVRDRFVASLARLGLVLRRSGLGDGRWGFEFVPELVTDAAMAAEMREIYGDGAGS